MDFSKSLFCSQESYSCERPDVATSCYLILGSDQYWTCLSSYLLHWGRDRSTIPSEQIFGWQQCSSLQFLWLHLQLPGGVTGLEQVEDPDWFLIHQRWDYCSKLLLGVLHNIFGLDSICQLFHCNKKAWNLHHNLALHNLKNLATKNVILFFISPPKHNGIPREVFIHIFF